MCITNKGMMGFKSLAGSDYHNFGLKANKNLMSHGIFIDSGYYILKIVT